MDGRYNPEKGCKDECLTNDDCDNGVCNHDKEGIFKCFRTSCNDDSECNYGKCIIFPGEDSKRCLCQITHAGIFCDSIRTCDHDEIPYQPPCLNNGICYPGNSEDKPDVPYTCDCSDTDFTGFYCEDLHPCHPIKVCLAR